MLTSRIESRKDAASAPTTVYLPGGPGTSFLDGASGFPCSVDDDGQSTSLNPWSWNNEVNMLYIDVPCQTGFSYTNLQNGTFALLTNTFSPLANGSCQVLFQEYACPSTVQPELRPHRIT